MMRAKRFSPRTPVQVMMRHRKVYRTDHPQVFRVINRAADGAHTVVVLAPDRAICSCPAGQPSATCWAAYMVLKRCGRKVTGGSN